LEKARLREPAREGRSGLAEKRKAAAHNGRVNHLKIFPSSKEVFLLLALKKTFSGAYFANGKWRKGGLGRKELWAVIAVRVFSPSLSRGERSVIPSSSTKGEINCP